MFVEDLMNLYDVMEDTMNLHIYNKGFIIFAMVCSIILGIIICKSAVYANNNTSIDDFSYYNNNGEIIITGYSGEGDVIVVPDYIDGKPVISIGNYAFRGNTALVSITIPEGVTIIGDSAFSGCKSLEKIELPESILNIGDYAFNECKSLEEIYFSDNLSSIGTSAFRNCSSLSEISIPDGVVIIRDRVFYECDGLKKVHFSPNTSFIGERAFDSCENLTELNLPEGLETIGDYAFAWCTGLDNIIFPNTLVKMGKEAFYGCDSLKSIVIPGSLIEISEEAFCSCNSLSEIVISSGVESIGVGAFSNCSSLERISIPNSVTTIGVEAFESCWDLVEVTIPSSVTKIGVDAFSYTDSKLLVFGEPGTVAESYSNKNDISFIPCVIRFSDVRNSDFYCYPVLWGYYSNPQIASGITKDKYKPLNLCNRAQVVTFLWRYNGCPEPWHSKSPFKDVTEDKFYYKAVLWAYERNITSGRPNGLFDPLADCSRAEFVTFLWRSKYNPSPDNSVNPFVDVPNGAFYREAVLWANEKGITYGTSSTKFSPSTKVNRAQVITFLYRSYGKTY